tara:strand:- start:132 stop:620 length:489 start_codon:yes stop_codon:yes gene_type:complete
MKKYLAYQSDGHHAIQRKFEAIDNDAAPAKTNQKSMRKKALAESTLQSAWEKAASAGDSKTLSRLRVMFERIEFEESVVVNLLTDAQIYEIEHVGGDNAFVIGRKAVIFNSDNVASEIESDQRVDDRINKTLGQIFSDNVNERFIERSIERSAKALALKIRA